MHRRIDRVGPNAPRDGAAEGASAATRREHPWRPWPPVGGQGLRAGPHREPKVEASSSPLLLQAVRRSPLRIDLLAPAGRERLASSPTLKTAAQPQGRPARRDSFFGCTRRTAGPAPTLPDAAGGAAPESQLGIDRAHHPGLPPGNRDGDVPVSAQKGK
jgi:hypothetical protein